MNEIRVRIAKPEDTELIADISRKTFFETFGYLNTKENMDLFMREQFSREQLMEEVLEPGNIFLLAYNGAITSGYVRLREGEKHSHFSGRESIEIARIYVSNKYIGTGIGQLLMRKSILLAKEMKKEIIWLGVWEKNEKAIRFYNRFGFQVFGKHLFLLGKDEQTDLLLYKDLAKN
ncbi:MAG: GNAT family N-acetyltransferase [Terrimonas sp.]|nr:GNAT family N-acetyltransferase [Terrimonas sp.]